MAKKRKQRSSESASTQSQPQPQHQQEQPQEEEQQQSLSQPIQEEDREQEQQEEEQELRHSPQNMSVEPQQQQQQSQEVEAEIQKEEQEPETLLDPSPKSPQANGNGDENKEQHEEEDQDDLEEEEPLDKLLEPFGKDQLLVLLKRAVDKYPDLMDSVREIADADPAHRKIFVHGLGWDTTADTLISEFGKYGEIEDCKAVTDRVSGKSKGYAFILFKHRIGARKALKQPQKKIGNRVTSCQLATTGPVPAPLPTVSAHQPPGVSEYTQRKIFVSNVSAEIDPEKLLEFFRQFGEIEDGPLGLDKQTGKPKGFALFVYKSLESAKRALEEPHKNFEGHTLHCQKAIDGPKSGKQGFGGVGGGSHHHHQQQHHHHHHQQHYHHAAKKGKYSAGPGSVPGHLMAPSGPPVSFNPGMPTQGLNPALGQALTALIATQGAGLGLGNLLGGIGGAPLNQGGPPTPYGNQATAGYGNQPGMQGGYPNPQMGPGGPGRSQQGGAPYMGH